MAMNDDGGASGAGDGGAGAASAADLLGGAAGGGDAAGGEQGGGEQGGGGGGGTADAAGGDVGGSADPDWYGSLSADADGETASLRDWVKSAGFKDPNQLAKAARDNMTALRESGRVKVPGEGASEADVAAFHKAIGVPDDAKGYTFAPPKDAQGNDVPLDSKALDRIAAAAHKAGVPKAAMEAVVAEYVQGQLDDIADADAQQGREVDAKLKSWGNDRAAKEAAMNNALKVLGLGRDEALAIRSALGVDKSLDLFVRLGEGLAEDKLITGGSGKFGVSGAAAQAELTELQKDRAWVAKARTAGTAENARYERLTGAIAAAAEREEALANAN